MTDTWPEACPTCEVIPTQDGGCQHYDLCWFCDTVIATAEGLRSCEAASSVGNAMINNYRQSQQQITHALRNCVNERDPLTQ